MSAYKQLNRQDVYVSDYQAQKSWRASGSLVSTYGLETLRGFSGSTPGYPYPSDYRNYRYEKLVYNSIRQNYLALSSRDLLPDASATHDNGDIYYTGSFDVSFQSTLTLSESRKDTTEVGVVSIPKDVYGTKIVPGTFVAQPIFDTADKFNTDGYVSDEFSGVNQYIENIEYWYKSSPSDTGSYVANEGNYVDEETPGEYITASFDFQRPEIVDDSQGRLILSGAGAAFSLPERYVGEIIYNQGNAVITDPVVARYFSTYTRMDVQWKSNLPIYTYNVHCTVKESELNHTFNPTALTGSDNTVRSNITGSEFRPYVTSIGLYNEANELIAVAKTNKPIPKSENVDMTFVIKIDV